MRRLAIDFGTTNTVAALEVDGQAPRTVTFGPSSLLPSAVYAGSDGITVGREAQRQARLEPSRFEPNPKRRIDDGEVLLGESIIPVVELIAAVLRAVAGEVRRQLGGQVIDDVRLTHPAQWGSTRRNTLLNAARIAGLGGSIELIAEPVAAAAQFTQLPGRDLPDGRAVAIYDLGGGTFDVAVVGRSAAGFTVLAEAGLPDLGGLDFDQAILDLIGRTASAADPQRWQAIQRPTDGAARRAARALSEDVRAAKETLSDYSQTEVALPDPFTDVLLTRSEFEGLVRADLMRSVEMLDQTLRSAGVAPSSWSGIFLVGGSSRIPLVARLIQDRFHVTPVALDQPETAVALGALAVPRKRVDPPSSTGPSGPRSGGRPTLGSVGAVRNVGPADPIPGPGGTPPRPIGGRAPAPTAGYQTPALGPSLYAAPLYPDSTYPASNRSWAQTSQGNGANGARPLRRIKKRNQRLILGALAAAVVLVAVVAVLIGKPFSPPTTVPVDVLRSGTPVATGTSDTDTTTTETMTTDTTTADTRAADTRAADTRATDFTTGETTTDAATTSTSPKSIPTTLSAGESAFLGSGFRVDKCVLPAGSTGSESTGPVRLSREALCELATDFTGGTVYCFLLTMPPDDVTTYLDYLAKSRKPATGSTVEEDHAYSNSNGSVSGRVITAEKMPISGVDHPVVAWSQTGKGLVGILAGTDAITVKQLGTVWNTAVGSR